MKYRITIEIEADECVADKIVKNIEATALGQIAAHELGGYGIHKEILSQMNDKEQGTLFHYPCKVGDSVYLIDRDENDKLKVYEGIWKRVSLVQDKKNETFELRGEISYDIYDCYYNDGRTMKHGMYVGQEGTRIGERVFFSKEAAEEKLRELETQKEII